MPSERVGKAPEARERRVDVDASDRGVEIDVPGRRGDTDPRERREIDEQERELVELTRRVQAGDRAAFDELFARLRPHIVRSVRRWAIGADVEDLLQDVFVEVFRSLPGYRFEARLTTWIYKVALRGAMRSWAKGRRAREAMERMIAREPSQHGAVGSGGPDERLIANEDAREVHRILSTLSPKRRMVLVLADIEGRSSDEVAMLVGTNALTVRTRLHYARKEFMRKAKESDLLGERFLVGSGARDDVDDGASGRDGGVE